MLLGFLAQISNLLGHPGRISWIGVLLILTISKCKGFWVLAEPEEQECKRGVVKEPLLSLLAVLIHRFTDYCERYDRILQVGVILIMSVREDKQLKEFKEFELGLTWWQVLNEAWEVFFCEFKQWSLDFTVLFLSFPLLEERLEGGLEVECHCSETGAFEVEVKVHVVLLLRICLVLGRSHDLCLIID